MPEKEGSAIFEEMYRLDYLVSGRKISIFTDHENLVYLYDPYGRNPGIARHTEKKLIPWAVNLCTFRYIIEHMKGHSNVWADIMKRWVVQNPSTIATKKTPSIKALMKATISSGLVEELDWSSRIEVIRTQAKEPKKQIPVSYKDSGNVWVDN